MGSDRDGDLAALRAFVMHRYLPDRAQPLADDEPLISSGIVDSMGLAELTVFLEETFDVFVGPDELGAGRADTLAEIAALLTRRR